MRTPPGFTAANRLTSAVFWFCFVPSKSGNWQNEFPRHKTTSKPSLGIPPMRRRSSGSVSQFACPIAVGTTEHCHNQLIANIRKFQHLLNHVMHGTCVFGTQPGVLWETFIHVAFTTRMLMVQSP